MSCVQVLDQNRPDLLAKDSPVKLFQKALVKGRREASGAQPFLCRQTQRDFQAQPDGDSPQAETNDKAAPLIPREG